MRQPKPYYKRSHQAWYANLGPNKRPIRLASKDEGEKVAWDKYHAIMADRQPADSPVAELLDRYLDWCQREKAESTYQARRQILSSFVKYIGNLRVSALKPHHVTRWLAESYPQAGSTHRHNLVRTIKGALKWAADEGYIDRSPIRNIKLPTPRSRDVYITPERNSSNCRRWR
jgi:hypothetical protein